MWTCHKINSNLNAKNKNMSFLTKLIIIIEDASVNNFSITVQMGLDGKMYPRFNIKTDLKKASFIKRENNMRKKQIDVGNTYNIHFRSFIKSSMYITCLHKLDDSLVYFSICFLLNIFADVPLDMLLKDPVGFRQFLYRTTNLSSKVVSELFNSTVNVQKVSTLMRCNMLTAYNL